MSARHKEVLTCILGVVGAVPIVLVIGESQTMLGAAANNAMMVAYGIAVGLLITRPPWKDSDV